MVIIISNRLIKIGDSIVKSTKIDAIFIRLSGNYLLLPMMPGVSIMMMTSSIHLQVLMIAVKCMVRTDSLVTTIRMYLTGISTLVNMLRTWLISIGWILLIIIIITISEIWLVHI